MEIGSAGISPDLASGRELWSLVRARRDALKERQDALAFVEKKLGSLLLGQDLTADQQVAYVRRMADTMARALEMTAGPKVGDLSGACIARERLLCRVGGMNWRPFPVSQRTVKVTPIHRRLQERMALALGEQRASLPQSARTCFLSVGIRIDVGHSVVAWAGTDRLELSGWGQECLEIQEAMSKVPVLPPSPAILYETVNARPSY